MNKEITSPYFIGWKATFERWGWYLLVSIVLWCLMVYVNQGNVPLPVIAQYYIEVGLIFVFIESLYWMHLLIINELLPKLKHLPVIFENILELLMVGLAGLLCGFIFNLFPAILIFGADIIFSPENASNVRAGTSVSLIISIVLYYIIERTKVRSNLQKEHLRVSRLEKENYQAELQGLKNQVSPHFLFDSLNTLTSIIPRDSEKAVGYTHHLSDLYRYYLRSAKEDLIPLSEELKILEAYQYLLKTRLGSQVKFSINVDNHQAQGYYLPPMVIQECIENAVKHNRATKEIPLQIEVDIKDSAVQVINNKLIKKSKANSNQTGWENIKKRYDLFGDTLPEIKESETQYKVILPMLKQE